MFGSGTNDDLKIDAPFCGVAKKSCGKKNAKQKKTNFYSWLP